MNKLLGFHLLEWESFLFIKLKKYPNFNKRVIQPDIMSLQQYEL